MKKTSILLAFLACSTILVTCCSVNFANANIWINWATNPPKIVIHTPVQNATYNVTNSKTILNVPLNFTISKPYGGGGPSVLVVSVWYTLNDSERFYINIRDYASKDNYEPLKKTVQLHLGSGFYNLTLGLDAKSSYPTTWGTSVIAEPITITVSPPPTPTATPTPQIQNRPVAVPVEYVLLISIATAAVVTPILFYRRHKKPLTTSKQRKS